MKTGIIFPSPVRVWDAAWNPGWSVRRRSVWPVSHTSWCLPLLVVSVVGVGTGTKDVSSSSGLYFGLGSYSGMFGVDILMLLFLRPALVKALLLRVLVLVKGTRGGN